MEEIKYFKVEAPKGYEIDKENSTWDNICFKKIEQEVRTWDDLCNKGLPNTSKWIDRASKIRESSIASRNVFEEDKCVFIDKKHAKSALAMAQISQLFPYFGGIITDKEWKDRSVTKYTILRTDWGLTKAKGCNSVCYEFLAFHTNEQRDNFLKYNERLVKDYLMLD